jgi:thiol-disulfide isomerase/thioredoxin
MVERNAYVAVMRRRIVVAVGVAAIVGLAGVCLCPIASAQARDAKSNPSISEVRPGLRTVGFLFEGLGGAVAVAQHERSPLLGKPAPDVQLKLLDGGEFQLKSHRDKEIVMMDFWATWCAPCVRELPILADVAKTYKDKGVAFRAINLEEEPEKIREFLKKRELSITVALDSSGKVGSAYGAEAIPMLVLIDKKGIVQSVHVGYDPAIRKTLRKELDTLLAGKDLAKKSAEGGAKGD